MPEILSTAPQFARVALSDDESNGVPVGHFHSGNGLQGRTRMLADFIGGCGPGGCIVRSNRTGMCSRAFSCRVTVGNVKEKKFLEIWHEAEVLQRSGTAVPSRGTVQPVRTSWYAAGAVPVHGRTTGT